MNPITPLNPFPDSEVERVVSAEALAELASLITSVPAGAQRPVRRRSRRLRRRTLVAGAVALAAVVVALLIADTFGSAGTKFGPLPLGPGSAQALSFTTRGRYIIVTVRNPFADPARYRAEFAAHHLRITLRLVAASPSIVGTLVYFDGGDAIKPISAVGRCFTGGGGNVCPVGVKIPLDFKGSADLVFGRPARPGEQYESAGFASAPGEALHGIALQGHTVGWLLPQLRSRHVTVAQWRSTSSTAPPVPVPLDWHVDNAIPWAPGQVLLMVSRSASEPQQTRPPARRCSPVKHNTSAVGRGTATPRVCRAA